MQNGIIKGQGNSRYLKSGVGSSTTWEQFLESLIAGTLPIDLNGINEDGWDQLGTPLNKATLLSDSTETELFGDAQNRTVDQAFMGLLAKIQLIMQNVANMTLTVTDTNGTPLPGVYVNGVFNADGESMATNASGQITGYVAEGTTTLSVSGYADLLNFSTQFTATKGETYTHTIQLTTRNFLKLTSSQNVRFSGNVEQLDVTAVGGGGGGGCGDGFDYSIAAGAGGSGGYCTVQENVNFTANVSYPAQIGAGGRGATRDDDAGAPGGTTSFLGVTADGGGGGGNGNSDTEIGGKPTAGNGTGGAGANGGTRYNQLGANGTVGTMSGYSSYTDTVVYGGGGGGGSAGSDRSDGDLYQSSGGGYGGDGGSVQNSGQEDVHVGDGEDGQNGFGGGGGGGAVSVQRIDDTGQSWSVIGRSGAGGSGCITMRMHLKSAA